MRKPHNGPRRASSSMQGSWREGIDKSHSMMSSRDKIPFRAAKSYSNGQNHVSRDKIRDKQRDLAILAIQWDNQFWGFRKINYLKLLYNF